MELGGILLLAVVRFMPDITLSSSEPSEKQGGKCLGATVADGLFSIRNSTGLHGRKSADQRV